MIVILDEGPYLETNAAFIKKYRLESVRNNWYNYYFEQPLYSNPNKNQLVPLSKILRNEIVFQPETTNYIFDSPSLGLTPLNDEHYSVQWKKNIRLLPAIEKRVNSYDFNKSKLWIGVHYRGTDKYNGPEGIYEHDAIHYDYAFVISAVDDWINKNAFYMKSGLIGIFIASDEQPFIEACQKHWSNNKRYIVYFTDSIRAQVSTSGLNPEGKSCDTNEHSSECKLYRNLTQTSVHLGMKELSSYKKGQDVLLDVLLLSKCNIFFRSQGNVSDYPKRINPNVQEISLNQLWKERQNNQEKRENKDQKRDGIKVFSFSLYGDKKKYCEGMIRNVQQIANQFSDWQVWIYMAHDVPEVTRLKLRQFTNVIIVPVTKGNMIDRFTAIDDPRVEIMMVRDADSRIHARDAGCIRDFENSGKSFHIIRDHNGHWYKILGGMWGMRRQAFDYLGVKSIRELYTKFTQAQNNASYGHDQDFLAQSVYPKLSMSNLLVHDEKHKFEKDAQVYAPFSVKLQGLEFVGQSYDVNDKGQDVALFKIEDYVR